MPPTGTLTHWKRLDEIKPTGTSRQEVPMLAPGEYLVNPVPPEPNPGPPAADTNQPNPPVAPAAQSDEDRPSFLLILLRALGAVHT